MPDLNKLLEKAGKYLQKQKFDSALETYLEIYKYQPNDSEVLVNLGDLSLRLNRLSDAIRYQTLLLDLYIRRNDVSKAIATCRKILKTSPQDVTTTAKLAALLEKSQKSAEALEVYREACELHRKSGAIAQAIDCLQHMVKLDPSNFEAHVQLAELAARARQPRISTPAFLRAAQLAQRNGNEERWAELIERAHTLDPQEETVCIATAEVFLKKERAADVPELLEPVTRQRPDDLFVAELLCKAYLRTGGLAKAEPLCSKLFQVHPEKVELIVELAERLLQKGQADEALALVREMKNQLLRAGKRSELLKIVEKISASAEDTIETLTALVGIFNEVNHEEGLRRSLTRLFNLCLAGEEYKKAAQTLERILDVDPYGEGHHDRLLNLEGHIDQALYKSLLARVNVPTDEAGVVPIEGAKRPVELEDPDSLDVLIVEGEMYHQYQLPTKLKQTLQKIDRLYPGAHQTNKRLSDLYELTEFTPANAPAPSSAASASSPSAAAPSAHSLDEIKKISEITSYLYRESTPQGVAQVAVNEVGRALKATRCWGALGAPERAPSLTIEYRSQSSSSSDIAAILKLYAALMRQAAANPDGWAIKDAEESPILAPVSMEIDKLDIKSLLAVPLIDRDQPAGLFLVQQCDQNRAWTAAENVLLKAIATQVVIAVNNTKLRRLVRSLSGSDEDTGLLPRSSYVDCLLAEAQRAKELGQPLSVCLLEPANPSSLLRALGDSGVHRYIRDVCKAVQSNLRQNDVAIRYSPYSIAVVFPDTALPQGGLAVEKLRGVISQVKLDGTATPAFCSGVCEVALGSNFDTVDGVTEVINRLESSVAQARKEGGKRVMLSKFEG